MESLIAMLNQVDVLEIPECDTCLLNNNTNDVIRKFIGEVSGLASEVLIGEEGQCLWDQHEILKDAGFNVFAGERDGFGWLTGCIQTKKGIVMFG